ncbi:hypothetical protein M5D96_001685 [Drosophila gunungcola]|uniref:Peptidase S1 domain-containing protein n=2 Tax=Drosophila gunungcola TaxID=103775 RepID=A0A9P9YZD2_9MUSC|nr:hypothetical protein M5D96_001685 [Drosophila gunungcola]
MHCLPPYEDYGVQKVTLHPKYDHGMIHHDIAIIELDREVRVDKHIFPICLPVNEESQFVTYDQSFYITGWGQTDTTDAPTTLQKVVVTRKYLFECQKFFKESEVNDNHICAEGSDIKHSCKGDSGGPIFYVHKFADPDTYRYVQYGVTSTGGDLCGKTKKQMEIFTSVISMLPWITQNVL